MAPCPTAILQFRSSSTGSRKRTSRRDIPTQNSFTLVKAFAPPSRQPAFSTISTTMTFIGTSWATNYSLRFWTRKLSEHRIDERSDSGAGQQDRQEEEQEQDQNRQH